MPSENIYPTARDGFAITPSDTTDFATKAEAIFCGASGTVAVVTMSGTVLTHTVNPGTVIPLVARRVNATGTTATGLIGYTY